MIKKKLYIKKINEVFCQLDSTAIEVESCIYNWYTLDLGLHPVQRMYIDPLWDGKLHLYNRKNKTIYTGLIDDLVKKMQQCFPDVILDWNENILLPELEVTNKDCKQMIDSLNIQSGGMLLTPREYQLQALYHMMMYRSRAVIVSPTGSGKSFIIYCIMRWLHMQGKKILLIVPNLSLITQMYNDFKEYATNDTEDFTVAKQVGIVSGGNKNSNLPVTLANWQAIYKEPQQYFIHYDAVLVDEVHLAQAKSLKGIMEKCIHARYRYGFTGTLQESKTHVSCIEGLFGAPVQYTTSYDLQQEGFLSPLEIKIIFMKYNTVHCKEAKNWDYNNEVEFVATNPYKQGFIVALSEKLQGNTLILVNLIDKQLMPLYNLLKEKSKKQVFFISQKVKAEERERIRLRMETEDNCILIATYGTCSTGVNIKNLKHIIFGSTYKSKVRTIQSVGRELRTHKNKDVAILWDLVDDFSTRGRNGNVKLNYLMNHAQKRMDLYRNERFPFTVMEKKIEPEGVTYETSKKKSR